MAKAAAIMKLYDKSGKGMLDKTAFVKLYVHFKDKESARLKAFCKDLEAIQVTKVCRVSEHFLPTVTLALFFTDGNGNAGVGHRRRLRWILSLMNPKICQIDSSEP